MTKAKALENHALRWSGVAACVLLWEAAPRLGWVDPQFAPPFSDVLKAAAELAADGSLARHLLVSLWRAATSLVAAVAIGIPSGFLLGLRFPGSAIVLDPFLRLLSQVNPFALMPVFILFFGIGETAKIVVIAWVCFWPILFYAMTAVRTVEPALVKTARSLGVTTSELYLDVILPASLPTMFVGLRIAAGLLFMMIVAAEMLGAHAGLGWLVHNSAENYRIPRIYAGATFIVLLGYGLSKLLSSLERALFAGDAEPSGVAPASGLPRRSWRPGWRSGAVAFSTTVLLLALGGRAVFLFNERSARLDGHLGGEERARPATGDGDRKEVYACPMHAFVVRGRPERCTICGMKLVKSEPGTPDQQAHPAHPR